MNRLFLPFCLAIVVSAPAVAQPRSTKPATLGPAPSASADDILPPAPPIPEAPSAASLPTGPAPLDVKPPNNLPHASEEFANKHYAQAAALFAEADRHKEQFTAAQRDEWAYCRLYAVAIQLNRGKPSATAMAQFGGEVAEAMRIGSDRLAPFGKQLLDEIHKHNPQVSTVATAGWQSVETASFRILYQSHRELALEAGRVAEAARVAMYERWSGPPGANWSPRCDIYLHPSGADYAKATGKKAEQNGHSTVEIRGGRVASRRIDLHIDDSTMLDSTLPSEITQVVLTDMFADEPLPRWALVGMAGLSESPEGAARYRRAIPALLKEQKLFAVGPFMERPGFTNPNSITAFYAESVSLVSYLVELRGPKAFTQFLREAPRRGIAKAITSHYGFRDAADLQDRWIRHVMGGS